MLLAPAYHGNGAVWYSLHYPIDACLTTLDHENRNRHHVCHFAWLKKQNHVCHRRQQRIAKPSSKALRHSRRLVPSRTWALLPIARATQMHEKTHDCARKCVGCTLKCRKSRETRFVPKRFSIFCLPSVLNAPDRQELAYPTMRTASPTQSKLPFALAQLGGSKHAVTQPEVCFVDWPSTSLFDHLELSPDTNLKKRLPAIVRTYADCHASTSCPYIVKRHQTVEKCRKIYQTGSPTSPR